MRRRTKYAWACFGLNSFAMFSCIGAGQVTGLDAVNRAAIGLAWAELALFVVGAGAWAYTSCCPRATPTTHTAIMPDDLELDSQEPAGDPDKAPSPLAGNRTVPTGPSPKTTQSPSEVTLPRSSAAYTPVRKVSV